MFNSSILDVIIGLVFCFASVALIASSVNEAMASMFKLRHKTLLTGVQQILNDPSGDGLAKALYEHALVNPLSLVMPPTAAVAAAAPPVAKQGAVKASKPAWAKLQQLPAYIDSKDFAHALMDIIRTAPRASADLKSDIDNIGDPQLRQTLQGFFARAQGDVECFSDAIANWFDNAMNRLSGGYKRQAQFWTFMFGFAVAFGLNIDAIYVLEQLWKRPEYAAAIVSPASTELIAAASNDANEMKMRPTADAIRVVAPASAASTVSAPKAAPASDASSAPSSAAAASAASSSGKLSPEQMMTTLATLPVGWGVNHDPKGSDLEKFEFYLTRLIGWLITASAAVFGAPFWFDLLQQLIQVRGTGAKPATNSDKKKPQVTSPATR